jgi:hypothetical protein
MTEVNGPTDASAADRRVAVVNAGVKDFLSQNHTAFPDFVFEPFISSVASALTSCRPS